MTADKRYLQRSAKYPLHQGKQTGVTAPFVELTNAHVARTLDPAELLQAVRKDDVHWGTPVVDSILSGKRGYLFRTEQVELALTAGEICRLVLRNLTRVEFFRLATRVGVFQEISGEFYNEDTGWALAPRFVDADEAVRVSGSNRPRLLMIEDLDGNLRPHSITSQERAEQFAAEVREKYGIGAEVVEFAGPSNPWRADPFDNAIALHYGPNGEMRAYGRFANEQAASEFWPRDGGFGYGTRVQVMSVPATAIF